MIAVNSTDLWLRNAILAPLKALLEWLLNIDLDALFGAIIIFFGAISNIFYALIEIGLQIVAIDVEKLKELINLFIEFAKLLKVDVISFLLASVMLYTRRTWMLRDKISSS